MGVPVATITSQGSKLDPTIELLSLEIHRELNRIPEATLVLLDGSVAKRRFSVSNLAFFLPGASIAIDLRYEGDSKDVTVFEGLVVRHTVVLVVVVVVVIPVAVVGVILHMHPVVVVVHTV